MRRLACLALLGLAACADLVPPRSSESYYEYRQISGLDTLSFKWLPSQLPVKIWVADDSPLRPHVVTAIDRWERAFLFGEFRATLVPDSNAADVIVRNTPPVSVFTASVLSAFAPQCTGETTFELAQGGDALQLPWRIFVWPASNPNANGIETCYAITITHELGHALGIINPNHTGAQIGDVMYRDPVFDGISERDRATVERLYHGPTTLRPLARSPNPSAR
jgi:predicted Zn-dependent protease